MQLEIGDKIIFGYQNNGIDIMDTIVIDEFMISGEQISITSGNLIINLSYNSIQYDDEEMEYTILTDGGVFHINILGTM